MQNERRGGKEEGQRERREAENNRNAVNSAFVRRAKDLIQFSVDS